MFSERPWALRFFDQIEWYPVSAEELTDLRAETEAGRGPVDVTEGEFDYGSYRRFLADNAASIADFRDRQAAAFATEKERWRASGEFDVSPDPVPAGPGKAGPEEIAVPDGAAVVTAPLPASVWRIDVRPGDRVAKGDPLLSLEAMKMETALAAPRDGTVAGIYTTPGAQVDAGQILATIVTGEPPAAPAARETPGALHAGGAPDVPEAPDAGGASDEYAIHMARGI
jgi:urea carboxylase